MEKKKKEKKIENKQKLTSTGPSEVYDYTHNIETCTTCTQRIVLERWAL